MTIIFKCTLSAVGVAMLVREFYLIWATNLR